MTTEQWETPEWDRLVADRLGRGPTEFEGYESWDDSDEAKAAYARGVAEAEATKDAFWGRVTPGEQKAPETPDADKAPPAKAKAGAGRVRQGSTQAS